LLDSGFHAAELTVPIALTLMISLAGLLLSRIDLFTGMPFGCSAAGQRPRASAPGWQVRP
jgi:hypothetical protein